MNHLNSTGISVLASASSDAINITYIVVYSCGFARMRVIILKSDVRLIATSSLVAFILAILDAAGLSMLDDTLGLLNYWLSAERVADTVTLTAVVYIVLGALYIVLGAGFYLLGKRGLVHIGSILLLMSSVVGIVYLVVPIRLFSAFGGTTIEVLRIVAEMRGFRLALMFVTLAFGLTGVYSAMKSERGGYQFLGFSLISVSKLGALVALMEVLLIPESSSPGSIFGKASLVLSGGLHSLLVFLGFIFIGVFLRKRMQEV